MTGSGKSLPSDAILSDPDASADLDDIRRYLARVPQRYAAPIRQALRSLLHDIAANPQRGANHGLATGILGEEVKSRPLPPYRIFHRDDNGIPEILGIIDMRRDMATILAKRVQ